MYYNEKLINGVWMYKLHPKDEWTPMSNAQLTTKIANQQDELNKLRLACVDSRRELLVADLKKVNQPIITLLEIADYERAADYLLGKL